ncbi:MAG TPA: hypothetical protein EYH44_05080 [Thermoprotei archaeon]|nr:hypothetical protein [Thermoprotei archaeon]
MSGEDSSIYQNIFRWAFRTGATVKEKDERLLKRLIFAIRGEETPGRFLDRLSETLTEYRTNVGIQLDVNIHPDIVRRRWSGDSFHYLRSTILSGFLNAFSAKESDEEGE